MYKYIVIENNNNKMENIFIFSIYKIISIIKSSFSSRLRKLKWKQNK